MRLLLPALLLLAAACVGAGERADAGADSAGADSARAADTAGGIIGHDSVLGPGDTTGVRELPPGTLQRRRDSARADTGRPPAGARS